MDFGEEAGGECKFRTVLGVRCAENAKLLAGKHIRYLNRGAESPRCDIVRLFAANPIFDADERRITWGRLVDGELVWSEWPPERCDW